jgi:hypothetical protein
MKKEQLSFDVTKKGLPKSAVAKGIKKTTTAA